MTSADLILHPIRLRIVKAFLGDRALTTRQVAAELDDVPAATVYRHVARLSEAGVLQAVAERRVRGTVERTYILRLGAAQIPPKEITRMSADEHTQAFMTYIAGILADFDRYLATGPKDPIKDGADYRVAAMWLTDAEFADLLRDVNKVLQPRLAISAGRGRKRHLLYQVHLPAPEQLGPGVNLHGRKRARKTEHRDTQR